MDTDGMLDLTNESAFTLALLDDTWAWRQRLVEQVRVADLRASVRSSYQVELPPALVEPFLEGKNPTSVKVLLPLTTKPKRLLSGFDLEGPQGRPAHLLTRQSIAAIEAEYIGFVTRSSPAGDAVDLLDVDLMTALCVFTPGLVKDLDADHRPSDKRYRAFLEAGLGFKVSLADLERWRRLEDEVGGVLRSALGEPHDWLSSAEHIGLALPFLELPPASPAAVDQRLDQFLRFIRTVSDAADEILLALIAEYGRRWEMIIETELPLGEPATVRTSEDRPMSVGRFGRYEHPIVLGDAGSYHGEISVDDANLEFARRPPQLVSLSGEEIGRPPIEGVLFERGAVAFYTSHPDRPYYGGVRFWLRPSQDLRYTTRGVLLILLPALVLGLFVDPGRGRHDVLGEMGVVAIATTLAVALLLVREATPLASRLLRASRGAVLVVMLAVWTVVLFRIAGWSGF